MNREIVLAVALAVLALVIVIKVVRGSRGQAAARQVPTARPAAQNQRQNPGRTETLAEFNRRMYGDRPDAYKPGAAYVIAEYKTQCQRQGA